jgi:hypothetical protein
VRLSSYNSRASLKRGLSEVALFLTPDYCVWAVSVTDYRVRDTAGLMALVSPRRFVEDGEMKEQRKGVRIEEG